MTLDKLLPTLTVDRAVRIARTLNREAMRYDTCRPRAQLIANECRRDRDAIMRHVRNLKRTQQ